jgi:hypothetical protein
MIVVDGFVGMAALDAADERLEGIRLGGTCGTCAASQIIRNGLAHE